MIKYKWTIRKPLRRADIDGFSNVVTQIYFSVSGRDTETGTAAECRGSAKPPPPRPDGKFVDFADLKEATLIAWIRKLPAGQLVRAAVEKSIMDEISGTRAPAGQSDKFPWES